MTGSWNIEVPGPGRLDNVIDVYGDGTKAGSRWDVSGSLKVLLDLEARTLRVLARHQILVAWRRKFPQDWAWAVAVVLCGSHDVVLTSFLDAIEYRDEEASSVTYVHYLGR